MNPMVLLETVYLGDRACKAIIIDCWSSVIKIQVDVISRVRGRERNFYADEDIADGLLVFSQVKSIRFAPSGRLPNDYIVSLAVSPVIGSESYHDFVFTVGSVDDGGGGCEVRIHIIAKRFHLEDPSRPGVVVDT